MEIEKGLGGMVTEETATWPQLRHQGLEGAAAAESTRYQVIGPAVLEVGQPEPAVSLPAHAGLKDGLEVTINHNKAEQVQGVSRARGA